MLFARLQRAGGTGAVICAAALLTLGLIILYSSSAYARDAHGDALIFLKRQLQWLAFGTVCAFLATAVPLRWWRRCWLPLCLLAVALLGACFIPGIGMSLNGSRRWIRVASFSFQPSELAKIVLVVVTAHFLARPNRWLGLSAPLRATLLILPLVALVLIEVDLGTATLLFCTFIALLFLSGVKLRWLTLFFAVLAIGIAVLAVRMPNRFQRLTAFMDPERYAEGAAWQQNQAKVAFGTGGTTGLGLGAGRQKLQYLPYAHTDFIFPVIGEELGVRMTLAVTLAFFLLGASALLLGRSSPYSFHKLLCGGIAVLLLLQAGINIAVTTSLAPNKGMPLPFISAGGSNLCSALVLLGLLLRVQRDIRTENDSSETRPPVED